MALFKQRYRTRDRKLKRSRKWYGEYGDADGITRRVALCTDKQAAQAMLNALVRQAQLQRVG